MTWQYWRSTVDGAPPEYRHQIIMTKVMVEKMKSGETHRSRLMMTFFGETPEAAQAKVDAFWEEAAEKAAGKAKRSVRAQATKAAEQALSV